MGLLAPTSQTTAPSPGRLLSRSPALPEAPVTQTTTPATTKTPVASPAQDMSAKKSVLDDIFNAPDNSVLGIIKNTITGIPKAAADYASGIMDADVGEALNNPSLNQTPAGEAINTGLGLPGAAPTIVGSAAQGINRDTVGAVVASVSPSQIYTPGNSLTQAIFGSSSVPGMYEEGREAFVQHGVNPKVASVLGLPFGLMQAVSDVYAGEDAEPIKDIARMTDPAAIEKAITDSFGVLKDQAPILAQTLTDIKDPAQVSQIIKDAISKTTADAVANHPDVPDLTYEPTEEEAHARSLEQTAAQNTAPTVTPLPAQYNNLAALAKEHPDAQSFLNAVADAPSERPLQDLYSLKANPIGDIKTPSDFYDAVTEGRLGQPERPAEIATEFPQQLEEKQTTRTGDQGSRSTIQPSENKTSTTDHEPFQENPSYKAGISENNGGVEPPVNKGGLRAPEIDFSTGKDKSAISLSTHTMERNIERIFPRETATTIKDFLTDPVRANETERIKYISALRKEVKANIVDRLGIHVNSKESELLQRYGEGRLTLDELMKESPKKAQNIIEANTYMRKVYDDLLNRWNEERAAHGIAPVAKRSDYFRHFQDMHSFINLFGFLSKKPELPTQISGITENFRSRMPWASAAMRRMGGPFTDDAIKGLDQYLNTTSRAIFHTDSVQRGRIFEKYLREAASARSDKGLPDIGLPNFASNLNDWVNLVSGKQSKLDRAIESVAGRNMLPFLSKVTQQFSKNVIGGSISSAVTHAIPTVFALATMDTKSAVLGLMDTLRSPFLGDFTKISGVQSGFLTRRFGTNEIEKNMWQHASAILSKPFEVVDQFISRFAVAGKYSEGVAKGLSQEEAMHAADTYAARVIGDRSVGNLPNLMNTKTLGAITQFQIEVNDNLQVLLHDIPYEQHGNVIKVAQMYVKFAIYSYLFNQTMQAIKGSGKGLDPIDLGLTLSGLNQEGKGQDLPTRAGLAATDFAKELPFTSIPTGGQVPAFKPIQDIVTKLASGDVAGGASEAAEDYGSPIGGGVQAVKTYQGIQDVNKGATKNAKGQLVADIPKTPINYVKGALFGPSAFPEQQTATKNETQLFQLIQQGKNGAQTVKAIKEYDSLKTVAQNQGSAAANEQFGQLKASDPSLAKLVLQQANNDKLGLTKEQLMVKQLGVGSGARAKYLAQQFNALSDPAAKKALWEQYVTDKIITAQVSAQLLPLLQK